MSHAFALRPLLVAAAIGAAVLWLWKRDPLTGALLGAGVQVGVRLAGVS